MDDIQTKVFRAAVMLTLFCGVLASVFAVLPAFIETDHLTRATVASWHSTLSYLFASGVGSVIGMIGLALAGGPRQPQSNDAPEERAVPQLRAIAEESEREPELSEMRATTSAANR